MESLSGIDDFWLRIERPESLLNITAMVRFERRLTMQALKAKFGDDLLRFRRFRQKVVVPSLPFGQPRWEDDPGFSLGNHMFERTMPAGDEVGLRRLLSQLMSEPLRRDKPLWEVHLIDGLYPGTTLLVRVHHCLADGFSLVRLMLGLIDADCPVELPGNAVLKGYTSIDEERADPRGRLRAARDYAQKLVDSGLRVLRNPVPDTGPLRDVAASAAHLLAMPRDSDSSLRGALGPTKVAAWSRPVALDDMKRVARSYDGTLNDIFLAALAGTLRRLLIARGEAVEGKDLRAVVPVNVQPWETRTDALGNGFGLVFIDLPVGSASVQDRLRLLKARMDQLKESPEAFVTYGLMQAVGLLPAVVQEQMVKLFEHRGTAVVTNMPGPQSSVRIAGQTVEDLLFFVPQSAGAALGVSIFTYAGSVRLGVAADAGILPDPGRLADLFHEELRHMGVGA